eukprot:955829_1
MTVCMDNEMFIITLVLALKLFHGNVGSEDNIQISMCGELMMNTASFTSNRNNFKNGAHGTLGIEQLKNVDTFDANIIKSFTRTKISNMGLCKSSNTETPPNIIFILMDDLGWHDVSYKGAQDKLKAHSVELTNHYIHLMCSPSPVGRYAMRQCIGKMLLVIDMFLLTNYCVIICRDYTEIGGIPIGQPTYTIGKWYCGYAYDQSLTTSGGFTHFFVVNTAFILTSFVKIFNFYIY